MDLKRERKKGKKRQINTWKGGNNISNSKKLCLKRNRFKYAIWIWKRANSHSFVRLVSWFCSFFFVSVCFRFQLKMYWQFYFTISDFSLLFFFVEFGFFARFLFLLFTLLHSFFVDGCGSFYLHDKSRLNPSWVNRFLLLLTISLSGFVIFMLEIEMILAILLNEIDVASAVSVVTQAHTLDIAWLLCGSMVNVCCVSLCVCEGGDGGLFSLSSIFTSAFSSSSSSFRHLLIGSVTAAASSPSLPTLRTLG